MKTVDKPKLTAEEDEKRGKILKSMMDRKKTGKIDIKSTFDLIHLSVYPLLENRKTVEDDMKQLKTTLDEAAGQIIKIIEKSKRKPPEKTPKKQ
jgi:ribosome recycling factor